MAGTIEPAYNRSTGLVDVLDRVLDKGLVVAGDVKVSLAEVELLTIRIRLLVCSIDKAEEIGLDWWKRDPYLSLEAREMADENELLRSTVNRLERRLDALEAGRATAEPAGAEAGEPGATAKEPTQTGGR